MSDDEKVLPETYDALEVLEKKLNELYKLFAESKYIVFFTGAGISTDAGVPDYRGEFGLMGAKKPVVVLGQAEQTLDWKVPTFSHLAIAKLLQNGLSKFLVTSNHDGIHDKAGTPLDKMADLFGNAYVEKCYKCKSYFRRRVIVPNIGRVCDNRECQGRIAKIGTRMGAMTPEEPLRIGTEEAKKAGKQQNPPSLTCIFF
jgi:NAD-dependent SIR2 family protein deacetylase